MKKSITAIALLTISMTLLTACGKKSSSNSTGSTSSFKKITDSCKLLTQSIADGVLGAGAKKGSTSAGSSSTADLAVSDCTYTSAPASGSSILSAPTVSLLVRSAKTQYGAENNKAQFGANKPTDVSDVPGYGDAAFWSPQYGQLNILDHNNWYIISNGPINPMDKTLADAKKLADLLKSSL